MAPSAILNSSDLENGTRVHLRDFDLGLSSLEADAEEEDILYFHDSMSDDESDIILPSDSSSEAAPEDKEEEASDDENDEVGPTSVRLSSSPVSGNSPTLGSSGLGCRETETSSDAANSDIDDGSDDYPLSDGSPAPQSTPQAEDASEPDLSEDSSPPAKKGSKRLRGEEREVPAKILVAIEYQKFRDNDYRTLNNLLEKNLDEIKRLSNLPALNQIPSSTTSLDDLCHESQIIREVIIEKYKGLLGSPRKRRKRNFVHHPATRSEMNKRLRGVSGNEEKIRPWSTSSVRVSKLPMDGMLYRVIDEKSQAKLYPDIGFLSASGEAMLDTYLDRHVAIKQHISWRNKRPTCFISTTDCPHDFEDTWIRTMKKRDRQKPSVCTLMVACINANARLAKGWPVLSVVEEEEHYKVKSSASFLSHEFLLPFRCSPDEIAGLWCWTVVEGWMTKNKGKYIDWHNAIVVPAFKAHEAARLEGRTLQGSTTCLCGCH